nr:VWA domain-containing protein [Deltaproteobacteria bacterium]
AVLSFSAIQNNDKIGVIFFSDLIEKFIPPKKGRQHILHIIRELINFQPTSKKTNIANALRYFTNAIKKRSTAFLISDFMDEGYEDALKICNKKHDLIALKVYDIRETELPPVGLLRLYDAETGKQIWVDSNSRKIRNQYASWSSNEQARLNDMLLRSGIDWVSVRTDEDYVKPLMNLFKKR